MKRQPIPGKPGLNGNHIIRREPGAVTDEAAVQSDGIDGLSPHTLIRIDPKEKRPRKEPLSEVPSLCRYQTRIMPAFWSSIALV